ncbi:MAG TPA: HEAT repeat domain-containing protein [bacterium]|jgi:HEAT repeat protein|nr:HEAT repeat domain-containing protein [bacterium]
MSENQKNSTESGPLYAPESGFSLFVKLFIVPAVIVLVALGIFYLGTMALQKPKTAQQYLEELKSDSTSRRWQSAYELSRMLNQNEDIQFDQALRAQLVDVYTSAKGDDPRLREYLALVLGRLKEKSAVPALSQAIHDDSTDVKIYSLWALGNIEDPKGGEAALAAMSDTDETVQRMAVGALSSMKYAPAKNALEKNLESSDQALRYDSAVALARLKDEKAVPTLLEMMNLKASGKPKEDEIIQSAKITAIEGAQELPDAALKTKVVDLSKNESDLKVREAALAALKK